ncbi:MAG: hypothetical protein VR65_20405 [Desulfobulbaceae bacterium BRH_c16a]|nr:MAG: hypothetical protein VR65_20405 [Desulfobulbaceae bacterium BRH_c16a]
MLQRALIGSILAVILSSVCVIVYTNKTLHSIESNLPSTLLTELNSLSVVLDGLADVVTFARIAAATKDPVQTGVLRTAVDTTHQLIVELRDTYVINNHVNASAFHAVVAPAIADLQIWLEEGVSGWGPDSGVTLSIVESRISETFRKAAKIGHHSRLAAQATLDSQKKRLEAFQQAVNVLYVLTLLLVFLLIYLLIRQRTAILRESEARDELQMQHNLLQNLLHHLPLGIAVWGKNRDLVQLNSIFTDITGYGFDDLPNMRHWPALAFPEPDYLQHVKTHWKSFGRDGSACEYRVTCKNGRIKDIEFRAVYLPDTRIINTLSDVTLRNNKEKELQESRASEVRLKKMESLGLLAGGVAHDLNNIFSGIVSYPELILLELPKNHKLRRPIELMRESGLRATAIVQDLLTVARGVAMEKEAVKINSIIEDYLDSPEYRLVRQYHPGVKLECSLDKHLKNILGSRIHIRKILMNLVSNGFEAINSSGAVRITTANVQIDVRGEGDNEIKKGEYVILTVADQGDGISKEDLEKIFEPFYSKKVMGRSGTGLGLTVVWNVVQDHQGYITVDSSPTETRFTIYFPVTCQPERNPDAVADFSSFIGNGELILIVDDVAAQRIITCSIIEKLGYRVESVACGEDAVEFVKHQPVDLIILDMIMSPGMSGRETYDRIIRLYPGQKAIVVSGYAETEDVKETLRLGAGGFLKKPLMIGDLAKVLHSLLSAKVGQD